MNLRDWLLSSLDTLPTTITREFHLHVLVSSPRRHTELYPFAIPRPRTYIQDILILLSEQQQQQQQPIVDDGDDAYNNQNDVPPPPSEAGTSNEQQQRWGKRMLSVGIEACVYYIPSTSSGLLYISKVDTTGHGARPSAARTLVKSLVMYFCDTNADDGPTTTGTGTTIDNNVNTNTETINMTTTTTTQGKVMGRRVKQLWVHVFARAQGQYLFPNSSEYEGKKPLSDVRLCAWWKGLLGEVAKDVVVPGSEEGETRRVGLWYVLPGYGELEAVHALGFAVPSVESQPEWTYGHPYGQKNIPLPCPSPGGRGVNLGHYIPSFEDDPKSRFMDEMAYTTESEGVAPPSPKRVRKTGHGEVSSAKSVREVEENIGGGGGGRPLGEMGRVSADEFWERMGFRQECVAGAVTGFFTLGIGWRSRTSGRWEEDGVESGTEGEVSGQMIKRVMKKMLSGVEFSNEERALRGTESVEGTIRGLCEGMKGSGYERCVYGRRVVMENKGGRGEEERERRNSGVKILVARKRKR